MKNLISGILAVALVAGPASAQQVPTAKLPQVTVKLNGASGGGSGDITDVNIATTAPITGGANCATGACSFTLGLTGGTLSGLTATKLPVATGAAAVGDSAITHVSATGVTTFGGSAPSLVIGAQSVTESALYGPGMDLIFTDFLKFVVGGSVVGFVNSTGGLSVANISNSGNIHQTTSTSVIGWNGFDQVVTSTGLQISRSKALVDATATAFSRVAVANNSYEGGVLHYTIFATNATDYQNRSGSVPFAIRNLGGTETCTFGTASDAYDGTGTLTVTWDCAAGTDTVDLRATADTSLASTTIFTIQARVDLTSGIATVTPQ